MIAYTKNNQELLSEKLLASTQRKRFDRATTSGNNCPARVVWFVNFRFKENE